MRARTEVPKKSNIKIGDSHEFQVDDGRIFVIEVDSIDLTGAKMMLDGEVVRVLGEEYEQLTGPNMPRLRWN